MHAAHTAGHLLFPLRPGYEANHIKASSIQTRTVCNPTTKIKSLISQSCMRYDDVTT